MLSKSKPLLKPPGGMICLDCKSTRDSLARYLHATHGLRRKETGICRAVTLLQHTDMAKDMREQELLRAEMVLA